MSDEDSGKETDAPGDAKVLASIKQTILGLQSDTWIKMKKILHHLKDILIFTHARSCKNIS